MKSSSVKIDFVVKGDGKIVQEEHVFQDGLPYEQLVELQALFAAVKDKYTALQRKWGELALAAKKGNV